MKNKKKVIIVGGVAGGASTAARLRRLDESLEIIMFERGEYISFANCGLPYYIGGVITKKSALTLQSPNSFKARFNIDVRIKSEIIKINPKQKSVTVKDDLTGKIYEESYDKLVLSMGAEPIQPQLTGINSPKVFTLRNIPDTCKIKDFIDQNSPKTAVIVGGGYIGVEMAENLSKLGIAVTILEMEKQLIASLDFEMACEVQRYLGENGVKLELDSKLTDVQDSNEKLSLGIEGGQKNIECDFVVLAVGVKPETKLAKEARLEVTQREYMITNESMVTSDPDIYAVGDAIEVSHFITGEKTAIPLAGPANKQGRIAADNICGIKSKYGGTQGSSIVKIFDMTVASTGINEKTCQRLGLNYEKSFIYAGSHAEYYPGTSNMLIKTIFEKHTGKILGAQIVGFDGVAKRCDIFATAIRFGATAYDLTKLELCYAPPFSSAKDPVNMAGFVIENILTGKVKIFHWHDVEGLKSDKTVALLDVRSRKEYEAGHIEGFINIPLDELRGNLVKLDKDKKNYVHCHSGMRSYIACRILSQSGFEAYNLSGGYKLYKSVLGPGSKK